MTKDMTSGSPMKLVLHFAIPLMFGNLFQQFYSMVDTVIVGRFLGTSALAAVGSTGSINFLIVGFCIGVCSGFSIPVAQSFGSKSFEDLRRFVGNILWLAVGFSLLFTVATVALCRPILEWMDTPADIIDDAYNYIVVIFLGIPTIILYNALASLLRALGDSKTPLYAIVVAALMNVVLDLLFVVGFHWGIAGAAIATVVSQVASAIYCFLNVRRISILSVQRQDLRPEKVLTLTLLKLGFPMALQNAIIAVGSMVVQFVINGYGMLFLAGFTATNKLYGILEIAATSYGFAVTSYVGQNLGARLVHRIKQGLRSAVAIALVTSVIIGLAMLLFGRLVLGLFISGEPQQVEASMQIAYHYLSIMSVCLPILYMLHIYRSALMGLGDTVVPMFSGVAEMVVRIGVALLLPLALGQEGIYYAEVGAWTAAAVILVTAYYLRMNALSKRKGFALDEKQ